MRGAHCVISNRGEGAGYESVSYGVNTHKIRKRKPRLAKFSSSFSGVYRTYIERDTAIQKLQYLHRNQEP